MIQANEFRIGNLLEENGSVVVVSGLSEDKGVQVRVTVWPVDALDSSHGVEPIPLTEKWLLKFGFDIKDSGFYDKGDFRVLHFVRDNTFQLIGYNVFKKSQTDIGIQYVHQLQNLYFALAGDELTISTHQNS